MKLQTDTVISNRESSGKLKGMLLDFRSNTSAWFDSIEIIKEQAQKVGFNEQQTILLIKQHLPPDTKTRRRLKYLIFEKPRMKEQKKIK